MARVDCMLMIYSTDFSSEQWTELEETLKKK